MSNQIAGCCMLFGYFYAFSMAALPLIGVSSYQHSSICLPLSISNTFDQVSYKYVLLSHVLRFIL